MHAGRCVPVLHAHAHRLLGARALHPRQDCAAGVEGGTGLAGRISARLTVAEGRRFGLTVGAAFLALAGLAWWRGRVLTFDVAVGVGLALVIAALVVPARLGLFYRLWMGLAAVMSKVTTPIFMGIVYFVVVTP